MYQLNVFFFYRPLFLLELFFGETLFVFNLKRREHFLIRASASVLICLGLSFAFPVFYYNSIYLSFMCLVFSILSFFALWFCFDCKPINIIFCVLSGYAVQHLAYSIYQLLMVITLLDGGNSLNMYGSAQNLSLDGFVISIYIEIYVLIYVFCYLVFGRQMKRDNDFFITNNWLFLLLILVFVSAIILNAIIAYNCDVKDERIALAVTFTYSIINCLLILSLMFKLKDDKKTKKELEVVRHLWKEDKEHYELAKENIKIINIKCHDMKHQIHALREHGYSKNELDHLESSISIYDSICKTDNNALDVVLSEKSLYCSSHHITLSYIVDGKALSFMEDSDIYSLFGNAIDNAIEYLMTVEEDRRFLRINIRTVAENLSIHIENYYQGHVEFKDGLPQTTKGDKNYHGFGMVSIREIVSKYDGNMFIKTKNDLFTIDILLPIQEAAK